MVERMQRENEEQDRWRKESSFPDLWQSHKATLAQITHDQLQRLTCYMNTHRQILSSSETHDVVTALIGELQMSWAHAEVRSHFEQAVADLYWPAIQIRDGTLKVGSTTEELLQKLLARVHMRLNGGPGRDDHSSTELVHFGHFQRIKVVKPKKREGENETRILRFGLIHYFPAISSRRDKVESADTSQAVLSIEFDVDGELDAYGRPRYL